MPNNPFQNLPQGWEMKTLGEVCEIISKGATPKIQKLQKTYNDDVIFLKAENITINGDINFNNAKFIDYKTHTQILKRSILKNNDILITIAGSLARCAIVEKSNEMQINLNQAIAFARLKEYSEADSKFIKSFILSPAVQTLLFSQAKTTAIPNLTLEIIKNLPIPLPPLQTQQKIVAKLESEFAKIEAAKSHLEKVKETIPRLKNSLLKSAFSGELTQPCKDERGLPYRHCEDSSESKAHNPQGFCPHSQIYNAEVPQDSIVESKVCRIVDCHELRCNSRNDESIAQAPNFTRAPNLGGATSVAQNLQSDTNPPNYRFECNEREESRIVDSHRDISHFSNTQYDKKDNLPRGWEIKTLGEVCEFVYGKALNQAKRKTNGKYPVYAANGIKDYSDEFMISENSIIVGRKGSVGSIVLTSSPCWVLDVAYYINFDKEKYNLVFLYHLLKYLNLKQFARGVKPGISRSQIYELQVVVPPLPTQKQIVEILDSKFAALENLKKETNASLENLQRLKSSLLNLAFKGELI